MRHILSFVSLLLFFLFIHFISSYAYTNVSAQSQNQPQDNSVSVGIGTPILKLYGYTSPNADVALLAFPGTTTRVFADKTGYFEFKGFFITSQTREICIEAIDNNTRITNPVCIPSPGVNYTQSEIGPVILPPTISLEAGAILADTTVKASGQSIPNSKINISFFQGNPTLVSLIKEKIIPSTYAFSLPSYTIETDQNGNYSFNLPSSTANQFRVFSSTLFNNSPSPKSNTLTFDVLTIFEWIIRKIIGLIFTLMTYSTKIPIVEAIIVLQIFVIALLFMLRRKKNKSLMIPANYLGKFNQEIQINTTLPAKRL